MKSFTLSFIIALFFFIFSCNTTNSDINRKVERVSINNSEVFVYQTGISGDEELAKITQQPDHYEISKIVRDSTTQGEAVYKYKPKSGFKGTDQVEIKLGTGANGSNPNTNFELIKIEFTVN